MKFAQGGWLDEGYMLSLSELCELSGLSESELRSLVECGAIAPVDPAARDWAFGADLLVVARSACRLRRDFELDSQGLALAVALLERVRDLEEELRELRARFPSSSFP
jgi:chaperone modulatory protein CbpM